MCVWFCFNTNVKGKRKEWGRREREIEGGSKTEGKRVERFWKKVGERGNATPLPDLRHIPQRA